MTSVAEDSAAEAAAPALSDAPAPSQDGASAADAASAPHVDGAASSDAAGVAAQAPGSAGVPANAGAADGSAKRRSRWGAKVETTAAPAQPADAEQPKKRSRWGSKPATDPMSLAVQLGIPLATLQAMSEEQRASLPAIKLRLEAIDALLGTPDCGVGAIPPEQRSPSPDPIFDKNGDRVNTRIKLKREALEKEKAGLIDGLKPKPKATNQRQWRKLRAVFVARRRRACGGPGSYGFFSTKLVCCMVIQGR